MNNTSTCIFACAAFHFLISCTQDPGVDRVESLKFAEEALDAKNPQAVFAPLAEVLAENPDDLEARWSFAKANLMVGDGAAAEHNLRRAVELGLSDESALPMLVKALFVQEKLDDIVALQIPPSLSGPARAELLAYKGIALLEQGRPDAAESSLRSALEVDTDSTSALIGKSLLARSKGDAAQSRKVAEKVLEFDPSSSEGWSIIGDLDALEEKWEAAELAFTRAAEGRYDSEVDLIKRAIVRIRLDDLDGAQEDVSAVLEKAPQYPAASFVEGQLRLLQGRYLEAQTALEKALNFGSEAPSMHLFLGLAYAMQGNWQQAADAGEKHFAIQPNSVNGRKLLALVRLRQERFGDVESLVRPVVNAIPEDTAASGLLAAALSRQGGKDAALALLKELDLSQFETPEDRLGLGLEFLTAGDSEGAIKQFDSAIRGNAEMTAQAAGFVMALLVEKKVDKALGAVQTLKKKYPDSVMATDLLGAVHLARGELPQAKRSFEESLASRPENIRAHLNLAKIASRQKDSEAARRHYESALAVNPNLETAVLGLAELDGKANNRTAMVDRLEALIAKDEKAYLARIVLARYYLISGAPGKVPDLLAPMLDTGQINLDAHALLGRAYLAQGDLPQARLHFERLGRLDPDASIPRSMLGQVSALSGEIDRAKNEFETALRLDPNNFVARLGLARVLLQKDDRHAAEPHLLYLKEKAPDAPQVLFLEAQEADLAGDEGAALQLYEKLFNEHENQQFMLLYARYQAKHEDLPSAARTVEAWLARHAEDVIARRELADYWRRQGKEDAAVEAYQQILRSDPSDLATLNNLAWIYKQKDPARALELAEQAYSLKPTSAAVLDTLAMVLVANNRAKRALAYIDAAVELAPSDPTLLYHKAVVLEVDGNKDEASELLENLLIKENDFPERSEAEKLAQRLKVQ